MFSRELKIVIFFWFWKFEELLAQSWVVSKTLKVEGLQRTREDILELVVLPLVIQSQVGVVITHLNILLNVGECPPIYFGTFVGDVLVVRLGETDEHLVDVEIQHIVLKLASDS